LPEGIDIPQAVPRATKTFLIFDLPKALCYLYLPGAPASIDIILQCLIKVETEVGVPLKTTKLFYFSKDMLGRITDIAYERGYTAY
jgi:hypothetical protein